MPDLSPTEHNPTVGAIALPGGLSHPLDLLATDRVIGNRHSNQVGRVAPDESQLANLTLAPPVPGDRVRHVNLLDSACLCEACGGSVSSQWRLSRSEISYLSEALSNEAPCRDGSALWRLSLALSHNSSSSLSLLSLSLALSLSLSAARSRRLGSGNLSISLSIASPNVTLYELCFKNVGRGNKRATIKSWKKSHFDELIISSKRVILANNGAVNANCRLIRT